MERFTELPTGNTVKRVNFPDIRRFYETGVGLSIFALDKPFLLRYTMCNSSNIGNLNSCLLFCTIIDWLLERDWTFIYRLLLCLGIVMPRKK